ncbi:hypothetical protein GGR52DRAFT_557620 [Hypoxylon sp. FL1284]|nr:hypothetical protein GGR52DRAFT_557620 [Hypoxylon sp. FL1284]
MEPGDRGAVVVVVVVRPRGAATAVGVRRAQGRAVRAVPARRGARADRGARRLPRGGPAHRGQSPPVGPGGRGADAVSGVRCRRGAAAGAGAAVGVQRRELRVRLHRLRGHGRVAPTVTALCSATLAFVRRLRAAFFSAALRGGALAGCFVSFRDLVLCAGPEFVEWGVAGSAAALGQVARWDDGLGRLWLEGVLWKLASEISLDIG